MKRVFVTVNMTLDVPENWEILDGSSGTTKSLKVGEQYLLPVMDWLVADEPTENRSLFGMIDEQIFAELDRAVKTVAQDIVMVEGPVSH